MLSIKKMQCDCGGKLVFSTFTHDGMLLDSIECTSCPRRMIPLESYKQALKLKEANEQIHSTRKIIKVGSSIAALLPKKLERYGVKEGMVSEICVLGPRSLQLKFNKDLF